MSVTKILFKQSANAVTAALNTTIGEPLWHIDSNAPYGQLYITNGDSNRMPTLIGPYIHPDGAITVGSNITGSNAVTGGYLTGTADSGYAIGGLTIDSTGHVVALSAVQLPQAVTPNDATLTIQKNGTAVGTFTANASQNATVNIEANKVEWTQTQSSGTPIATITIDGTATTVYAPTAGTPVQSVEEVYAKTLSGETSAIVSTDPNYGTVSQRSGVQTVTFKHEALNNGSGSFATFVAGSPSNGNIDVTMSITIIDGGSW